MPAKCGNNPVRQAVRCFESRTGTNAIPPETHTEGGVISAWQGFCRLSSLERGMFFRGVLLLPLVAFALRFIGLRDVERLLALQAEGKQAQTEMAGRRWWVADQARRMTEAASRYGIMRGNCLSRSIVLCHLLRQQGIDAVINIGARRNGPAFEAHAWVELDGRTINDSPDVRRRFAAFDNHVDGTFSE
jgi:hypothetical protein